MTALPTDSESSRHGRKPVISSEVEDELVVAVERGLTIRDACMAVGIHPATFFRRVNSDPDFRERMYRARRKKVLALAEMAEQAMQVAVACGDWRAPLAMLKLTLQRLDREFVEPEPENESEEVDPAKVAAVIHILHDLEAKDAHHR